METNVTNTTSYTPAIAAADASANPLSCGETLQIQLMKNHAIDLQILQREYGIDEKDDSPIRVFKFSNDDDDELESAPPVSNLHRSLAVEPIESDTFGYWVIKGAFPEIFDPRQDSSIVYLHLDYWPGYMPTFCMEDRIYWFAGDLVVAHANIDEVLEDDIIVVADGLIVPVTVTFKPRALAPFKLTDNMFEECNEARHDFLDDKQHQVNSITRRHDPSGRATPRLATRLDLCLGNLIIEEIEIQCSAKRVQ
jgi:hypothetical protein